MVFGHGGVIQVKVLAYLRYEVEFLVDTVQAQRSDSGNQQRLIGDILVSSFVDLKSLLMVPRFNSLAVHSV